MYIVFIKSAQKIRLGPRQGDELARQRIAVHRLIVPQILARQVESQSQLLLTTHFHQ